MAEGIRRRHRSGCRTHVGGRCNCKPAYEAWVFSRREDRKIRKTFSNLSEARNWRYDAQAAVADGRMKAPSRVTLKQAADTWLEGARSGAIRNRSGDHYKPSAIRSYEAALRLRVLPALGDVRLAELRRVDVQGLVEALVGRGLNPSTIQVTLLPLQAICRRAVSRGELTVNPTTGIERPAVRSSRDRIASPEEAGKLIAALPVRDRALWATAMYGGLRRGELMALRWQDIELAKGVIRVQRGWDAKEGPIQTKGKERRTVPIPAVLRDYLVEHRMSGAEPSAEALAFGSSPSRPFGPTGVRERADAA